MTLLVTGADGFVGRWLLHRLAGMHRPVIAAYRADGDPPLAAFTPEEAKWIRWVPLDLRDDASVASLSSQAVDGVVHLAAVASGREARNDPGEAWNVNAGGTARLLEMLAAAPTAAPRVVVVSTGEVYGWGSEPHRETDPLRPISPYAASKAGAETAAEEVARRTGLPVIIARPFPHTGPGQAPGYVVPAFAARLREAKRTGARTVATGNLEPVRDLLDVRDVVAAYLLLLERGDPGQAYNVASGAGVSLRDIFDRLARLIEVDAEPVTDPALLRAADLPVLIGDPSKLRAATGWTAAIPLAQTLRDLVDAQAD